MPRLPLAVRLVPLVLIAAATPACIIRLGGSNPGMSFGGWGSSSSTRIDGHEVSDHDGHLVMDGRSLHHARWVDVPLPASAGSSLQLDTATGPLSVEGRDGDGALRVRLWSEVEGDGSVVLEDGRLVAHGENGLVLVNEITGHVPNGMSLRATSSTGAISLSALSQAERLEVQSGTGDVRLVGCAAGRIDVAGGTSDVTVNGGDAGQLELASGTGDLRLADGRFGRVLAKSGTGDVSVRHCQLDYLQADSGTGDLVMHGGRVGELHHDLGTGDVSLLGGVTVGQPD